MRAVYIFLSFLLAFLPDRWIDEWTGGCDGVVVGGEGRG